MATQNPKDGQIFLTPRHLRKPKLSKELTREQIKRNFKREFGFIKTDMDVIRQGNNFQADIPEIIENDKEDPDDKERPKDLQIWCPTAHNIIEEDLKGFIETAKNDHGMSEEQALMILSWKRYKFEEAKLELFAWRPVRQEVDILNTPSGNKNHVYRVYPSQPRSKKWKTFKYEKIY